MLWVVKHWGNSLKRVGKNKVACTVVKRGESLNNYKTPNIKKTFYIHTFWAISFSSGVHYRGHQWEWPVEWTDASRARAVLSLLELPPGWGIDFSGADDASVNHTLCSRIPLTTETSPVVRSIGSITPYCVKCPMIIWQHTEPGNCG